MLRGEVWGKDRKGKASLPPFSSRNGIICTRDGEKQRLPSAHLRGLTQRRDAIYSATARRELTDQPEVAKQLPPTDFSSAT